MKKNSVIYHLKLVHPQFPNDVIQSILRANSDNEAKRRAELASPGWMVVSYTDIPEPDEKVLTAIGLLEDEENEEDDDLGDPSQS